MFMADVVDNDKVLTVLGQDIRVFEDSDRPEPPPRLILPARNSNESRIMPVPGGPMSDASALSRLEYHLENR